jgi:hypothetical protein
MEIRVDKKSVEQAAEWREKVERSGQRAYFFVEGDDGYPYLRALAIQVVAAQWRRQGHAIDYLTTKAELVAEVENEILTSGAWAEAQTKDTEHIGGYLWQAARFHLKRFVENLIDHDSNTTALYAQNGEGDEYCVADWENHHEPSAEAAALRHEHEPWYALRAAQAAWGQLLQALGEDKYADLALRWVEGEDIKDLAAEEDITARALRGRLFGYYPDRDGIKGSFGRAAEAADLDLSKATVEDLRDTCLMALRAEG